MIFFGSRGKVVSGQVVEGVKCPSCENMQFITFGALRYFHLYWIPTFITSRKVGIECTHCKRTFMGKELPDDLSREIKRTVFKKKNTVPMFSGLIIIACVILFTTSSAKLSDIEEASYVEQPAQNDLYIVNLTKVFPDIDIDPEYKYGVMRIKNVYSDQAEFQIGNIGYSRTSGARKDIGERKTSIDSYYYAESMYVDLGEIKKMKESDAILSVERT